MDDHHRYDRVERAENGLTPLSPGCNHMDIIGQHLGHLRRGEPILRPSTHTVMAKAAVAVGDDDAAARTKPSCAPARVAAAPRVPSHVSGMPRGADRENSLAEVDEVGALTQLLRVHAEIVTGVAR